MKQQEFLPSAGMLRILAFLGVFAVAVGLQASDWTYRTAHNYVLPAEDRVELTDRAHLVRPIWSYDIHTGIGSSSSGPAREILAQGFEPTYGETAAAVVVDGVYILSWSEATGDVIARPESLTDRYWRGEANYNMFRDTYLRIDANWNTIALDAATGEKLWQVSQPSASINFQSSKRSHNGIDPAAGNGIYVTITVTGRVYAYDIATGETRWETNVGQWHEEAEAFKAEALAKRNLPVVHDGMFGSLRPGAAMVGDMVIIPDLRGGLIALQSKDGAELWRLEDRVMNRQGSPRLWEHQGKTYLLTHENRRGDNAVYLIDPSDGSILWSHETGHNPGKLIMGEDTVLLNPEREDPGLLAAYRISLDGLEQLWRFPDVEADGIQPNHVHLSGSRGAERKGVIDDGRLYIAIGQPNNRPEGRRLAVFDLATGEELYRSDYTITSKVAAPVSYGDKLYWQITSTSAQNAGLYVYQKHEDGRIERLGEVRYRPLGAMLTVDYEHPTDRPFSEGRTFLRGRTNLVALDLREPEHPPVDIQFENAWAGFRRPLSGVVIANEDREVEVGRMEVPPRRELGVPGTAARRNDVWGRLDFSETLRIGQAWDTTATMGMAIFSWPVHMVMQEARGNEWHGQWTRAFPGWDETMTLEGALHESSEGGYPRRGWPTEWLEHQPVTFFSDLEERQERVFLQIRGALPRQDGSRQDVTICLDHDGEKVVSAVAGGFRYNQSYHEVDASGLEVSPSGIKGTAHVILNGDPWLRDPDWKNGGSLLGRLTLDVQFGEPNDEGVYPVTGGWTLEWGASGELSGKIRATLEQTRAEPSHSGDGSQGEPVHSYAVSERDGSVTITGYRGPGGDLIIPSELNGKPVTSIARRAFMNNSNITSVVIPDTVTNIGREAFRDVRQLTTVFIPASVTYIALPAFNRCHRLMHIHVADDNPEFSSIDGVLFNKDQTAIRRYPIARSGHYTIPDTVTVIMDEAFRFCTGLTGVTIPDGVTFIGKQAFRGCDGLTSITLPGALTTFSDKGRAFKDCINLTSIVIPEGITSIPRRTFRGCVRLESITFEGNITAIGGQAFYDCRSLKTITIPASVTQVGCGREGEVFADCENLSSIYFLGDAPSVEGQGLLPSSELTVYRLESAEGWPDPGSAWMGRPTALFQSTDDPPSPHNP